RNRSSRVPAVVSASPRTAIAAVRANPGLYDCGRTNRQTWDPLSIPSPTPKGVKGMFPQPVERGLQGDCGPRADKQGDKFGTGQQARAEEDDAGDNCPAVSLEGFLTVEVLPHSISPAAISISASISFLVIRFMADDRSRL